MYNCIHDARTKEKSDKEHESDRKIEIEFMMIGWFHYKRINVKHLCRRMCACASMCVSVQCVFKYGTRENVLNSRIHLSEPVYSKHIVSFYLFLFVGAHAILCALWLWLYVVCVFAVYYIYDSEWGLRMPICDYFSAAATSACYFCLFGVWIHSIPI